MNDERIWILQVRFFILLISDIKKVKGIIEVLPKRVFDVPFKQKKTAHLDMDCLLGTIRTIHQYISCINSSFVIPPKYFGTSTDSRACSMASLL